MLSVVWASHILLWIIPIELRHDQDMQFVFYYSKCAESLIYGNIDTSLRPSEDLRDYSVSKSIFNWTSIFQIIVTSVLCFLAGNLSGIE